MASIARRFEGHLRTVSHLLRDLRRPPPAPPAWNWRGALEDPQVGTVAVSGRLTRSGRGSTLVILVHGLGGTADSPYLVRAAQAGRELGIDTLRLNLRGADPAARDLYHAGLTAEIHATVADRAFRGYERIAVLGYSMGGHVALRFAAEVEDPRLAAVAAVCAPLHLAPVSKGLDRPSRALYRFWVLRQLRRSLAEIERIGGRLPNPYEAVRRARTFRHWDSLTVVPRFGFDGPDDYYARTSAAAVLDRLRVPCLLVASVIDPVITPQAIEPFLPPGAETRRLGAEPGGPAGRPAAGDRPAGLTVLWHGTAGHVAFPSAVGLERRLLRWLATGQGPAAAGRDPARR